MYQKGYNQNIAKDQAERFIAYYESIGWLIGRQKTQMKDWQACVRGWMLRKKEFQNGGKVEGEVSKVQKSSKQETQVRL